MRKNHRVFEELKERTAYVIKPHSDGLHLHTLYNIPVYELDKKWWRF